VEGGKPPHPPPPFRCARLLEGPPQVLCSKVAPSLRGPLRGASRYRRREIRRKKAIFLGQIGIFHLSFARLSAALWLAMRTNPLGFFIKMRLASLGASLGASLHHSTQIGKLLHVDRFQQYDNRIVASILQYLDLAKKQASENLYLYSLPFEESVWAGLKCFSAISFALVPIFSPLFKKSSILQRSFQQYVLMFMAVGSFLLSFTCFALQTLTRRGVIEVQIGWHVDNVWGYHEDFHFILVIAHTFTSHLYDTLFEDNNDKGDWVVVSALIKNSDHAKVAYEAAASAVEGVRERVGSRVEGVRERVGSSVGNLKNVVMTPRKERGESKTNTSTPLRSSKRIRNLNLK